MLGAFPYEYQWYQTIFQRDLPINVTPMRPYLHSQQPFNLEQILFYNQIFEEFLTQCFAFSLSQLGPAMQYVI